MNDRRYGDHDRSYETQRHHAGGPAQQHLHDRERGPPGHHDDPGARFGGPPAGPEEGAFRGVGPAGYKRSDVRISDDLHDALTEDSHLDASGIKITVKDGEATLDGKVPSRACKRRAEDLADRVPGIHHVQNNLRAGARP